MENREATIIAVVSQKGGVGKSIIDLNIAIKLAYEDLKVCLVDVDQDQYTASDCLAVREEQDIQPLVDYKIMRSQNLEKEIAKIIDQYDVILVECGGKDTDELRKAIVIANIIIMPIQPSGPDIKTIPNVESLLDTLSKKKALDRNTPCFIIPNRVASHQKKEINFERKSNPLVALYDLRDQLQFFKITNNFIKDRPNLYGRAYVLGKAIFELEPEEVNPDSKIDGKKSINKAKKEFNNLFNEIFHDN